MYSKFQLAKKYISYWLAASNGNGHGIHSPFVFEFVKFVLNDQKEYPCYPEIELLRKQLLHDHSTIEVEDFGAGSAVIKTNIRIVSRIAASSLKPKKFAQLLFRIVQYYKPATIVELGTSFGISTAYLAKGNPKSDVFTLEGAKSISAIAKENFQTLGLPHIHLINGDFQQTLPELFSTISKIDLAFVDGNHRKAPTLEYFTKMLHLSKSSTILIFDDIHWSKEMEEAWSQIQQHKAVTLTIDLFFIGLVFVNPDFKVKQHFSIRF
ncbi:MAG: class I SAM-dependent methyltransferase [Ferruginibacter sp.]